MKGKVLKKFRDKITRSIYAVDDVIERDETRITEINKADGGPFIAVIEEPGTKSNDKPDTESKKKPGVSENESDKAEPDKPPRTSKSKKAKE